MPNGLSQNPDELQKTPQTLILKYEGEDDQSFFVSGLHTARISVPKNRSTPKPFRDRPPQPLTPAFRLLAWAFVGLAPAGLGALVLAPLAALWALVVLITRPLPLRDRVRVMVVWAIAALLVGIAHPLSDQVLAHLHIRGRFP
jgi:hypothetical protein